MHPCGYCIEPSIVNTESSGTVLIWNKDYRRCPRASKVLNDILFQHISYKCLQFVSACVWYSSDALSDRFCSAGIDGMFK